MSHLQIGILGIVLLFVLIGLRMHIGIAMGVVALAGMALIVNPDAALTRLAVNAYEQTSFYLLAVIPLFVFMGEVAAVSGISAEAYYAVSKWVGHYRGGLAMATVGGCAAFAAVSSSSIASAVTMVTVSLPEMRQRHYSPGLGLGSIAAGGTLGILIPPSTAFAVYGIITEQSIGRLFLAGFVPGIMLTVLFCGVIAVWARANPSLAPSGPAVGWRERFASLKNTWAALLLFLVVIGSIYLGIVTVTEAAAVGAFATLVIGTLRRRLVMGNVVNSLMNTLRTTGMIFLLVIGAMLFNYFLALSGLTSVLGDWITALPLSRLAILGLILLIFLILGCLMDAFAMMILFVPIIFPVVLALGYDPIWFGVLNVIMMELGMITPPIGLNVFVLAGMARDVPITAIFRGIFPFVIAMVVGVGLLVAFPQIALLLPYGMKGA